MIHQFHTWVWATSDMFEQDWWTLAFQPLEAWQLLSYKALLCVIASYVQIRLKTIENFPLGQKHTSVYWHLYCSWNFCAFHQKNKPEKDGLSHVSRCLKAERSKAFFRDSLSSKMKKVQGCWQTYFNPWKSLN